MTAAVHQRQHRQGNGRSAPPTDPLALVRDNDLPTTSNGRSRASDQALDRGDLDYIADAIRAAADCLHDLRHGRLP